MGATAPPTATPAGHPTGVTGFRVGSAAYEKATQSPPPVAGTTSGETMRETQSGGA